MKRKSLLTAILSLVLAAALSTAVSAQDLKTRVNEIEKANLDGKIDGVIDKYELEVKENPDDPVLHYLLGLAYLHSDFDNREATFDEAYRELIRAKELDPNMKYVNYSLGTVYWYRGDFEKALESYSEEIRLDPEDGWNYYNLGIAYEAMKKWDKAWSQYIIAIEKDPTIHDAHNNLGRIAMYWKGDYFRALEEFEAAMKLKPTKKLYKDNYNKAIKKLKELKKSVEKGELTLPADEQRKLESLDLKEVEVE